MERPATINRTHDLTYHAVPTHLIKTPGITSLHKVIEGFNGNVLWHWYVDQHGEKYRVCDRSVCGYYGPLKSTKAKWICESCTATDQAVANSKQAKIDYANKFSQRVKDAVKDARKSLHSANVRKGRDKDTVVFDYYDGVEASLNCILGKFNLKLGYARRMEHPNARYNRRYADVREINPMRHLEKALNGEM